ncbi:CCHC-type domain-containing protein [Trichonephila clavipes]|nr:CCHC-type domain-containing protein [Trichonephila clavipes]
MEDSGLIAREPEKDAANYEFVKKLLPQRLKLSLEKFRQLLVKHQKNPDGTWKDFYYEIRNFCEEWLNGLDIQTFEDLKDLLISDQMKKKVPTETYVEVSTDGGNIENEVRSNLSSETRLYAEEEAKALEEGRKMEEEKRMNERENIFGRRNEIEERKIACGRADATCSKGTLNEHIYIKAEEQKCLQKVFAKDETGTKIALYKKISLLGMSRMRKTTAGSDCSTVPFEEFVAVNDDNMCTAPMMADKDILEFFQNSEDITDADSDTTKNEFNNAVPVPTSSKMRNIKKKKEFLGAPLTPPKRVTRFPRLEEGNVPINTSWSIRISPPRLKEWEKEFDRSKLRDAPNLSNMKTILTRNFGTGSSASQRDASTMRFRFPPIPVTTARLETYNVYPDIGAHGARVGTCQDQRGRQRDKRSKEPSPAGAEKGKTSEDY